LIVSLAIDVPSFGRILLHSWHNICTQNDAEKYVHDEGELMERQALGRSSLLAAWLGLGVCLGGHAGQIDTSPAVELLTRGSSDRGAYAAADPVLAGSPWHEAMGATGKDRKPERLDRAPPPAIVERPGTGTPSPDAQWIEGYWTWNESRRDFDWVTGVWRVAPAGKFWVRGYWRRDPTGWSRVPGFWSDGHAAPAPKRDAVAAPADRSRTTPERSREIAGPLPERPREIIGPPPGPGYFYVPGEYVPQGSQLVWKAGIWYPSQPGWEWIPAHWVRQASGWTFREGYWNRVGQTPNAPPGGGSAPAVAGVATSVGSARSRANVPEGSAARIRADAPASDAPGGGGATDESAQEISANAPGNGDAETDALVEEKTKPPDSPAQAPARVRYTPSPSPAYYNNSWGGMQWNGRAPFGGILGRFFRY
jgi:hypothetical protein